LSAGVRALVEWLPAVLQEAASLARPMVMIVTGGLTSHGAAMTRSSDLDDFGAFYTATYQRAYRIALAIVGEPGLAADVTQDAFVAAFRARRGFRGDAPADAWLARIVVNGAISAARKQRLRWAGPLPADLVAQGESAQGSVDRLSILAALQVLPVEQRAAVVLRYYLDDDYATIARTLGTNVGTVGSWLSRGVDRLRSELRMPNEGPPEPSTTKDADAS
jgi:RNA polymerase sigma factor (sigma-70 family)